MSTIRVTYHAETASGRREGWGKLITAVLDNGERGAKRFAGQYLEDGIEEDLPVGAIVLETVPTGSVKNGSTDARFLQVDPDAEGGLCVLPGSWDWRRKFLTVVNRARALLAQPPPCGPPWVFWESNQRGETDQSPLAAFSTDELRAELERRQGEGQ